jgi:hypothetical protein
MADQRAAEPAVGTATPATGDATAPSIAAERPTPPAPAPVPGAPDELLCTICGLTACWKKPDEAKGS